MADTPGSEVAFELSLEDTLSQHRRALGAQGRKTGAGGYNPYDMSTGRPDASHPGPTDPKRKPTDLRKLSEWIRLQRQVEALKKDEPEPE